MHNPVVAVVGTGYVGLPMAAGFASNGFRVICADVDQVKIDKLKRGVVPIFEKGLDDLVREGVEQNWLKFTTDVAQAIREADVVFIAVGTPPDKNNHNKADLRHVLQVAHTFGESLNGEKIIVTKSTVPVGTAEKVRAAVQSHDPQHRFHVVSNPEFLAQGQAVKNFLEPDRVVIGVKPGDEYAANVMRKLYKPFVESNPLEKLIVVDIPTAEITKYACNGVLATKISFMNMIARLCEKAGADVKGVRRGMIADPRIGKAMLYASYGYGGSCFPKDVKALIETMRDLGVDAGILEQVDALNESQKTWHMPRLVELLGEDLSGYTFAICGLAFKADTDDMRESAAIPVIEYLVERGATVKVNDPKAMDRARNEFLAHLGSHVIYCERRDDAIKDADALFILTEWDRYRKFDLQELKGLMRRPIVFDGRNLHELGDMEEAGFTYVSIGRRHVIQPEHKQL